MPGALLQRLARLGERRLGRLVAHDQIAAVFLAIGINGTERDAQALFTAQHARWAGPALEYFSGLDAGRRGERIPHGESVGAQVR